MTNNERTIHHRRSRAPACVVLLLLVVAGSTQAQQQAGEPRSPYAVGFTTVAVHELNECTKGGAGRLSGILHPLGKLSKDGPVAWLLQHERCDTVVPNGGFPSDLWLVQSSNGQIPSLEEHQVIGATELAAETELVGVGDYDGNGVLDIAVDIHRFNDTSFGNTQGYGLASVAVFYGDSNYRYSLQDTVRLSNGTDAWTGAGVVASYDVNNDGADELLMWSGSGWLREKRFIPKPKIVGFLGTPGRKWGRDGSSNRWSWEWWSVPTVSEFSTPSYWERQDADCDGHEDVVIYTNTVLGGTGGLQVIYGTASGGFPDTTAIDVLDYKPILGARSVLSDVTGDGVPDLVVGCGTRDVIEVFAGKPGQRLQEMYGSGSDSADRANNRKPVRPWAHLQLPHALNDAWFRGTGAFNLGDADGDGVDEIWGESFPYIMSYRALDALDSLADIVYRGEVHYSYRIRDLQVNGFPVIVFTNNSRICYYRVVERAFPNSYTNYALPHDANFRCEHASGVAAEAATPQPTLQFRLHPNPANGQQQLHWQPQEGTATIRVHDTSGKLLWKSDYPGLSGVATWETSSVANGVYTISLTITSRTETLTTQITH